MNWDRFLHVCQRHGILALVKAGLDHAQVELPDDVGQALSARAAAIARTNLRQAAEEFRLCRAFEASGVDLLFVKGTSLALLAYGSLSVKTAWDIDLLVARGDVERACTILAGLGYERRQPDPAMTDSEYRRWLSCSKEMLWTHPMLGTAVELHFALVDNPQLLAGVGMGSPRQMVAHGDALALPTLATDELFSYMCVHGMMHFWARLKWLADVAALIATKELDCAQLYRSSVRLGAGRCGAVALLLCNSFFGTAVPEALIATFRGDAAVRALERAALAAIARRETHEDSTESASQLLGQLAAILRIKPGWRPFLAEIRYRLYFPYSSGHLRVWPWLRPLLTLAQIPRFVLARSRRG